MKNLIIKKILSACFCCLFVLCLSCKSTKTKEENIFEISANEFEFSLGLSDTLKKSVVLYNKSDRPIKILGIDNSCGCTSAVLKDSTILPLDSSMLHIMYVPKIARDSGNILKYITIKSNSTPAFRNITLKGKLII